jgi:DNA-directed RNA polymerase specialized sigma subunit
MDFENVKQALVLHYFLKEDKTETEIAASLQISESRVKKILTKHKIYEKCDLKK